MNKKVALNTFLNMLYAAICIFIFYVAMMLIPVMLLLKVAEPAELSVLIFAVLGFLCAMIYSYILMYFTKKRAPSVNAEQEVLQDFEKGYVGLRKDIKNVLCRENAYIVGVAVLLFACMLLDLLDVALFGTRTFSLVTVPFSGMYAFSVCFDFPLNALGYVIDIILIPVFYILWNLLYRRKLYKKLKA